MNDIVKEAFACHQGDVCVIFLSLRCVCGPAMILPKSTCKEYLTSKQRLPFDPENDFFQASSSCQIRNPELNSPPEDSSEATSESCSGL